MFFHRTTARFAAALACAAVLGVSVYADDGGALCGIRGACVTSVPAEGAVQLGSRVIRPGDVLTAEQMQRLSYSIPEAEEDIRAVMEYLPMGSEGLGQQAELVFSIRSKKNHAPTAGDSSLETYRNLPGEGLLAVSDPEGDPLTFTLKRQPRRGQVILRDDGSFLYTPNKNKVGTDSFVYTATDSAGNLSGEATVTISILKPIDSQQYADTAGTDCRFEAEWLRSTGIFAGERLNGQLCFSPAEQVTRGQFLAMLMEVLQMPVDRSTAETGFADDAPQWLRPYLAAALRSGIITGYPEGDGLHFRPDQPIRTREAALMVSRAVSFAIPTASLPEQTLEDLGGILTRSDAAKALYRISRVRRESGLMGLFG